MSHQLHSYLAQQLDKALRRDRVVVFYDARSEFEPFMAELEVVGTCIGGLPRTRIGDTLAHMAWIEGSFFDLKARIEPLVSADKPEALLIYLEFVFPRGLAVLFLSVSVSGFDSGFPSNLRASVAPPAREDSLFNSFRTLRDTPYFLAASASPSASIWVIQVTQA
jgi:hypothetical protein